MFRTANLNRGEFSMKGRGEARERQGEARGERKRGLTQREQRKRAESMRRGRTRRRH